MPLESIVLAIGTVLQAAAQESPMASGNERGRLLS
jgi:hypothetical protein